MSAHKHNRRSKANKRSRAASLDIWESDYLEGAREMRREAKIVSRRAGRRMDKAEIETALFELCE